MDCSELLYYDRETNNIINMFFYLYSISFIDSSSIFLYKQVSNDQKSCLLCFWISSSLLLSMRRSILFFFILLY